MLPAACIVPETSASPAWVDPLVPVFSPLVHLCPVPEPVPVEPGLLRLIQDKRLLALCPPLPQEEGKRLAHLADLLSGADAAQHSEQLKQLILESLGNSGSQEETMLLRQQLRAGAQNATAAPASSTDNLWQERLLLLLADQAERAEEALAAELSRIGKQHQSLFATLDHENDDGGGLEDVPLQASAHAQNSWQPKRLQAWVKILSRATLPCAGIWYITRQTGLAEQVQEQYQLIIRQQSLNLPDLLLPTCNQEEMGTNPLLERCPGLLEAFTRLQTLALDDAAIQNNQGQSLEKIVALFAEQIPAWNGMIRATRTAQSALSRLQLSILPGISFPRLLTGVFAMASDTQSAALHPDESTALCLFGFLSPPANDC
ncbi:MAG: hypothetical protein GX087_09440 [Desulfobulbaceae bacterium]|nr:hypothetical protein [Desulfobulbaceae bacterium]